MTAVRNVSPGRVDLPSLGLSIDPGATAEVPPNVAAELLDRPEFERPTTKKGAKSAASDPEES